MLEEHFPSAIVGISEACDITIAAVEVVPFLYQSGDFGTNMA